MQNRLKNKNITILSWRDKHHPEAGGSEEYIVRVAEYLAQIGNNVTFLTANHPKSENRVEAGVKYVHIGGTYTQFVLIPLIFFFKLRKQTDILIENFNAWPYLTPILHKNNHTIIHHIQTKEWEHRLGKVLGRIFLSISKILINLYKNKNIITVSPSTKKELLESGFNESKVTLAYNGIDNMFFAPQDKRSQRDSVNILFLGRLAKGKRIPQAIKHVQKIIKQHPEVQICLSILGAGEEENAIKELTQTFGIPTQFYGRAPDPKKLEVIDNSDLHVQFSEKEGWSITVIETASRGVPTICLDVPGLRDSVLPNTGYIAKAESDFQSVLETAIFDTYKQTSSYNSKCKECVKFSKEFSWETTFKKIEQKLFAN